LSDRRKERQQLGSGGCPALAGLEDQAEHSEHGEAQPGLETLNKLSVKSLNWFWLPVRKAVGSLLILSPYSFAIFI